MELSAANRLALARDACARRAPRTGSLRLLMRQPVRPAAGPGRVTVRVVAAQVTFSVKLKVKFGQHLRVVGSAPELGGWNPASAPELSWNDGDVWTGSVALAGDAAFKFCVFGGDGEPLWEDGDDRKVGAGGEPIAVTAEWRGAPPKEHSSSRRERDRGGRSNGNSNDSPARGSDAADELVLAMAGADGRWQGKEVTFMSANDHSGSRRGGWKPEGLSGAALRLVEGDMCAPRRGGHKAV